MTRRGAPAIGGRPGLLFASWQLRHSVAKGSAFSRASGDLRPALGADAVAALLQALDGLVDLGPGSPTSSPSRANSTSCTKSSTLCSSASFTSAAFGGQGLPERAQLLLDLAAAVLQHLLEDRVPLPSVDVCLCSSHGSSLLGSTPSAAASAREACGCCPRRTRSRASPSGLALVDLRLEVVDGPPPPGRSRSRSRRPAGGPRPRRRSPASTSMTTTPLAVRGSSSRSARSGVRSRSVMPSWAPPLVARPRPPRPPRGTCPGSRRPSLLRRRPAAPAAARCVPGALEAM